MSQPSHSVRIAIISDTHGIIEPNILELIKSCDQVIHAGDICTASVLSQITEVNNKLTAVIGNNDIAALWAADEADIVNAIPRTAVLELPGGKLCIEHGHIHGMHQPDHQLLREAHPEARMIVYGHTHTQIIDDKQQPTVINPGAAGHTRTRGGPSCLILEASEAEWKIEKFRFEESAAA